MELINFRKWFICVIFVAFIDVNFASPTRSLVGIDPCRLGPRFWCASAANARKCRIATNICVEYRFNDFNKTTIKSSPPSIGKNQFEGKSHTAPVNPPIVGNNPCTWGPSYWCASAANAKKCGLKEDDCAKYSGIKNDTAIASTSLPAPSTPSLPGSNPCTWGPDFWCASATNAQQCGLTETDCAKYGGIKNDTAPANISLPAPSSSLPSHSSPSLPAPSTSSLAAPSSSSLHGRNPCSWGPSYWCTSAANANHCGFTEAECAKYGGIKNNTAPANTPVSTPAVVGGNPCTWGPDYWCANAANAKKCGLTAAECGKYGGIKNAPVSPPTK